MSYQQSQSGAPTKKGGYGKRPLWQWVLIYVIVGGIVYGGIYYFVYAKKGGYNASNANYNYNTNAYINTNSYNNVNMYTNTNSVSTNTSTTPYNY